MPQRPLRLGRPVPVEQAQTEIKRCRRRDRTRQAFRRLRQQVARGAAIDRGAGEIVWPGVGDRQVDSEFGGRDRDEQHGFHSVGTGSMVGHDIISVATRRHRPAMKLLALDTTCATCSVAVWDGTAAVAHRVETMQRGHAEALMPMVEAVLAESGLGYAALDAIAVTRGPGTFTGLRIGLAAARGLALAAGLPLIGLTTLEVIAVAARRHRANRFVSVMIEARRGEVYSQTFAADGVAIDDAAALAPEAALRRATAVDAVLAGDAAPRLAALTADVDVAPGDGLPDAVVLAARAAERALPRVGEIVAPLYLRPPDAKLPGAVGGR